MSVCERYCGGGGAFVRTSLSRLVRNYNYILRELLSGAVRICPEALIVASRQPQDPKWLGRGLVLRKRPRKSSGYMLVTSAAHCGGYSNESIAAFHSLKILLRLELGAAILYCHHLCIYITQPPMNRQLSITHHLKTKPQHGYHYRDLVI